MSAASAIAGAFTALTRNMTLKLLSFGLALVLFLFVRGETEEAVGIAATVILQPSADRVLVSEAPDRLRVMVRGKLSRIREAMAEDLEPVRLDLADVPEGEFFFTGEMVRVPTGLRVVALQPASVRFQFEPRVAREVPVEPVLVGDPDPAFLLTGKTVKPSTVGVSGARSTIDALERVRTVPIDMGGRWESTVLEVGLTPPGKHMRYDPPLQRVTVRLKFEERVGKAEVKGVAVRGVGTTRYKVSILPATVDLSLEGPMKTLRDLAATPTLINAWVNIDDLDDKPPGSYPRRLQVDDLPKGVRFLNKRFGRFRVVTERVEGSPDAGVPPPPSPPKKSETPSKDAGVGAPK